MANRILALFFDRQSPKSPETRRGPAPATHISVDAGGREIHVKVRRHPNAKRYTLRLTARGDGAVVTIPPRGSLTQAKSFVGRHAEWLAERLVRRPAQPACGDGDLTVLLRGREYRVAQTRSARGLTSATEDSDGRPILTVSGDGEHLSRRLQDFLKREARKDLTAAVQHHAAKLGVTPTAIRLKDTTSRWGSASTSGTLCFSWRLIMAPPFVLDYVAAHEVAHLREMNHSDRFWALCYTLAPQTDAAKAWLKANGRSLHRAV